MALTLTEANKLSNDTLRVGVIETVVKHSPVLQFLPFIEILGNGYTYNRENSASSAAFYAVGDTWTEGTTTFSQVTVGLKILGGDADIDAFLAATRQNLQDITATMIQLKARAVAYAYETAFLYGNSGSDPNSFDGLMLNIAAGQQIHLGSSTTPAVLTLNAMDQMMDLIKSGSPEMLLMTRRTRRGLSKFVRASNTPYFQTTDEMGKPVMAYNGTPAYVSDFLLDTEALSSGAYSAPTGGASASMLAMRFGEDAIHGIQGPSGITVEPIGALETKDAQRYRIKWYASYALLDNLSVAKIDGISSGDVTT